MLENWKRRFTPFYAPSGPVEWIVAGLGNPGKEYDGTRHNAGFRAVEKAAGHFGVKIDRLKFKALCGDGMAAGKRVLFMKPSTYMNKSGEAVRDAASFYKIPMERVIVLCDDITQPPGKLRIRRKGSDGGHNGLKNIIYLSGSDQFPRIRIGVGAKPHPDYDLAAWVLGRFDKDDSAAVDKACENAVSAMELIIAGEIDKAMNLYNG